MIWSSFSAFLDMGGYGLYVWGAYSMAGAALVWEAVMLVQRQRRALEDLRDPIRAADDFEPAIAAGGAEPGARTARHQP